MPFLQGQAHAQRCLPKMQGIEVRANMADGFNPGGKDGGYSFGAALSTYTKKGNKWVFGGEYLLKNNPYKDTKIPVAQFTAEGGYYFKILSDARKIVFAYAGASALAGYESVNWGKKVLHDGSTLHDRDTFIYGGALTLDVECYVADRIALACQPAGALPVGWRHKEVPHAVRGRHQVHHQLTRAWNGRK